MSECRQLRPDLVAVADSEADGAVRARVEAHLAVCEPCRQLARALGQAPDFGRVHLPANVAESMRLALHERFDRLERLDRLDRERQDRPGVLAWLFSGSLAVPKPLAWAALVLLAVTTSLSLPAPRPPAPPVPAVLMEGVDHTGPLASWPNG